MEKSAPVNAGEKRIFNVVESREVMRWTPEFGSPAHLVIKRGKFKIREECPLAFGGMCVWEGCHGVGVRLSRACLLEGNRLVLHWAPVRTRVSCPLCGVQSQRIHSRYRRQALDLPWFSWPVRSIIQARRFFCDSPECERRIFVEPFPRLWVATPGRPYGPGTPFWSWPTAAVPSWEPG